MSRKTATNIVEVWNWLINVLESGELTATEQAALVHVIAKINRNMWTPTKINPKLIAAAIDKDARTVKTALSKIVSLNILTEEEGAYYIGSVKHNQIPDSDTGKHFQFRHKAGSGVSDIQQDSRGNVSAVGRGANSNSDQHTAQTQSADGSRKLFRPDDVAEP